jgi:hypothetical protein
MEVVAYIFVEDSPNYSGSHFDAFHLVNIINLQIPHFLIQVFVEVLVNLWFRLCRAVSSGCIDKVYLKKIHQVIFGEANNIIFLFASITLLHFKLLLT